MCGCVTSSNLSPTSPDVIPLEPMTSHVAKHLTSHLNETGPLTLGGDVTRTPTKRYAGTSMDDVLAMRAYNKHNNVERRARSTSMECTCRIKHTPTHTGHLPHQRNSWGLDSLRRYDSSTLGGQLDDGALQQASWYQAGIPREIALEILSQEEIGSFIVRDSTTHPNCYALSVRVPKFENPTGISHYLIKQTSQGGYMLKGLDKEWPSLTSLVTHHTVMQEKLPCTLRLPRNAQNPTYHDVEADVTENDDDDDYQRLSDFTSMMADLKMEK